MNIYIHTLEGKAAIFDGRQICFAPARKAFEPAYSREQIMAERRASAAWRKRNGHKQLPYKHGYVRYSVPETTGDSND